MRDSKWSLPLPELIQMIRVSRSSSLTAAKAALRKRRRQVREGSNAGGGCCLLSNVFHLFPNALSVLFQPRHRSYLVPGVPLIVLPVAADQFRNAQVCLSVRASSLSLYVFFNHTRKKIVLGHQTDRHGSRSAERNSDGRERAARSDQHDAQPGRVRPPYSSIIIHRSL